MNIIISPLYGIGDVLMTTPALKILKERLNPHITCLSMFRSTYEVLRYNPHIDSLVYFPFLEERKPELLKFMLSLRGRFDCSINFYPSNRRQYNMLAYIMGAPRRIGHRYMHRDLFELNFLKNLTILEDRRLHNVEENVKLLEFLGIRSGDVPGMGLFLTPDERERGKALIKKGSKIKVGIHAGTSIFKGHGNKRWPKEKFVELISDLPDCEFYLFGGADDEDVNEFIVKGAKGGERISVLENLPIRVAAAAIENLDLFISNDSGLMHLAAAAGVPVVALFGPTNPDFVRPWGAQNRVVRLELPCSPCFYYSPKSLECRSQSNFKCIREIPVSVVQKAAEDLLVKVRGARR